MVIISVSVFLREYPFEVTGDASFNGNPQGVLNLNYKISKPLHFNGAKKFCVNAIIFRRTEDGFEYLQEADRDFVYDNKGSPLENLNKNLFPELKTLISEDDILFTNSLDFCGTSKITFAVDAINIPGIAGKWKNIKVLDDLSDRLQYIFAVNRLPALAIETKMPTVSVVLEVDLKKKWKLAPKAALYMYCTEKKISQPSVEFLPVGSGERFAAVVHVGKMYARAYSENKKVAEFNAAYNLCSTIFEDYEANDADDEKNETGRYWIKNYVFKDRKLAMALLPNNSNFACSKFRECYEIGKKFLNPRDKNTVFTVIPHEWFISRLSKHDFESWVKFLEEPAKVFNDNIQMIMSAFIAVVGGFYEDCGDEQKTLEFFKLKN